MEYSGYWDKVFRVMITILLLMSVLTLTFVSIDGIATFMEWPKYPQMGSVAPEAASFGESLSQNYVAPSERLINDWNRTGGFGNVGIGNGSVEAVRTPSGQAPKSNFTTDMCMASYINSFNRPLNIRYRRPCEGLCEECVDSFDGTLFMKMLGPELINRNLSIVTRVKK
ncbi:hypothetical protein CUJ83_00075 [Methanocella sp. CWC-04]|uniref:Uncharacterized protein n=1 Tax=Methanooceanicella nereidis TaxID=2052831 RepID=A0AAP2RA89_9EURY|nr:hypothetical protein [Methanocella sp. CWC-04]MCD1293394.1 hypothetical protein [Methanocella sp. CWC-04]